MLRTISFGILVGFAGVVHAFDFKGLVLGEPTTASQVEERLNKCVTVNGAECDKAMQRLQQTGRVRCGTGNQGATVCNGVTTVAGFSTTANIVIGADGRLRRVLLSRLRPDNFEAIASELQSKFGAPASKQGSMVQNAFGAQYPQVEYSWTDDAGQRIDFTKYAGSIDQSSLYFSTAEDRAVLSQPRGAKGDL